MSKTIVITGGGTGIGRTLAKRFHAKGDAVVLNGRRPEKLEAVAQELGGERVHFVAGDIGDPQVAKRLIDEALQRFDTVDALVNNAGIFAPKPFLEHTPEDVEAYLSTIFKGTFYTSQQAAAHMKARQRGSIVNVGSMWATIAINATPSSAYSGAKAAVHALTKNLALELAADGVRVNAVAPAVVETPVYTTFMSDAQAQEALAGFNAFHPLGRNGRPEDVASLIDFLISDDSAWITGAVIPVDGGVTAGQHR